jgi:tetratricopeptide (TPR) repeat protein
LAAGRLLARPDLPVARVVARLAAVRSRVEGDWNIVDDGAYEELPEKLRRAYRILGLHPGGGGREWATGETRGTAPRGPVVSFGLNAGAALLGVSEDDAEDLIDGLVDVQLLDVADGRYAMHDLVRLHAARRAAHEDSVAVREAAVLRAIEWYLRAAVIADTAVNPHRAADAFGPLYPALREQSPFTGEKAALAWLDAERPNLCAALFAAADRERHDLVWQMCEALWGLFFSLKYYDTWIATHRAGLESARRTGDPRPVFRVGIQLGRALYETRRFADAHEVLAEALTAATEIGDARHEATALEFIGRAHLDAGDAATAGDFIARALELEETAGRTRGVAIDLHHMGRVHLALGQFEAAAGCLERAAELFARVADPYNRARVLLTHGRLRTRAGRPDLDVLREALTVMRDQGRIFQEAEVLAALSEAATATGDVAAGRAHREAAIAAYRRVGSAKAEEL